MARRLCSTRPRPSIGPRLTLEHGMRRARPGRTAVRDELQAVVAASRIAEASDVISWWHHDWSMVSDTATVAAKRIRSAARAVLH